MYMVQVSNRRPCGCLGCGCHSGWGAKGHEAACGFRRWAAADALLRLPCLLSTPLRFQRPLPPHFVCLHLFTCSFYMLILHAHFTCSFSYILLLRYRGEITYSTVVRTVLLYV